MSTGIYAPPDASEEQLSQLREMRSDPRKYLMNRWSHPNDVTRNYDFRTNDGTPLLYLTDEDSPLLPDNWGDINIFLFARGCLKTTSCIGIANWFLDMYPNGEVLNTAPRDDQKGEVVDRFKERAEDSGLTMRRVRDKIGHQKFKTVIEFEDESKNVVYSSLKSRSAWGGGEGLRGLHSHIGIIDEFQDADEEMFSVFLEAIDQQLPSCAFAPTIFCIGTPKSENSFFSDLWDMSDQKTWSKDDLEWKQQSTPAEYGDGGRSYEVRGWHIDQYNSPLHDNNRIDFKRETYSKMKFANEVEAKFYSPADDLIRAEDVRANLNHDLEMAQRPLREDSTVTIGVDWGGGTSRGASKTVISVWERDGEINLLSNVDFLSSSLEPQDEVERLEDWIIRFNADKVIVDYGHGNKQLKDLQDGNATMNPEGYQEVVKGCNYGNVGNKYEPRWETDTGKKRYFTIDRGFIMQEFVDEFKHGNFVIPAKTLDFSTRDSKGTLLLRHLTAPHKELDETRSGKKKLNITCDKGRNDDAFQSTTYAFLGQRILGTGRTNRKIVSRKARGI